MTQPIKTIEEIAAMTGKERKAYLLSLTEEELKAIDSNALLKAVSKANVQQMVDNLNKNAPGKDNS